jgi:hypothetical protein
MKKVVWVDSYHEGYPWSDGIEEGIQTMLNIVETEDGSLESPDNNLSLRIFRMDTKNNTSEEFKQQAGLIHRIMVAGYCDLRR